MLVNRGKTVVDDILIRYQDMPEPASRFTKPAAVSHSPFITPERWRPRHYLLYIVAVDPTLSVRQIAEKLNQGRFPFRPEKTQINDDLANMFIRSGRQILTPRLTEEQKNYREIFAAAIQADVRIYLPWMFSDETMITRNSHNYYVRTIPTLMRPEESYARTEQYPIQVMM
jgi:hypothetical protein